MPQTTMVLKNARIYTMDGRVEEAVAIAGDKIAKVGSNQEIESWQGENTRVIDMGGRTIVPGFNDTHTHLVGYGNSLRYVNLENCLSCEEMCERIKNFIEKKQIPEGEWVFAAAGIRTSSQAVLFQPKRIWTKYPISI